MKKAMIAAFVLAALHGVAQSKPAIIQKGSIVDYLVHTGVNEVSIEATISRADEDGLVIGWIMNGKSSGTFRMSRPSLDSARAGYWNEPIDGQDIILPEEQILLCLSKACWKDIAAGKPMTFGSATYTVKEKSVPYKAGTSAIDCLLLESVGGNSFLWIANNEKLPLILKTENNPDGVNVEIAVIR